MSSSDREVLLALYRATGGPRWDNKEGWDTSVDISSWYGVTVRDGNVVELDLSQNNLQGPIPKELGQLSSLEILDLGWNTLNGSIPTELAALSKLEELNLRINQLTGPIPKELGQLPSLETLELSSNKLNGSIPKEVAALSKLKVLYLLDNQLTGPIPKELGQLPSLETLDLNRNKLNGSIPKELAALRKLKLLYLQDNQLTGSIPKELAALRKLKVLYLLDNQLTGSIPSELAALRELRWLWLNNNRLTGISEEAARGLQRNRGLNLNFKDNPWNSPPADVVDVGLERIVGYWEAITRSGAIESWTLKVVLVGAVKAGKTSLTRGMISGEPQLCHEDDRTKGVDVHVGEPCTPDGSRKLELIFWDFAGHSEYYSTHQVFLSQGALHLLVVDIERFSKEPSARGELVDAWLDALQCRVPGSSVLVVATQIDRLTGDLDVAVNDLRFRVETHLSAQHNESEGEQGSGSMSSNSQQDLVFHGVQTVSSARHESLLDLRLKLSTLVYSKRDMFPGVGQRRPVSWARASAMLDAKRSGKDPILQASLVGTVEQGEEENRETATAGFKFLHRADAIDEWRRVVQALRLEKEVESTIWDIIARIFKPCGNAERTGKEAVFENAVEQMVREGKILVSGDILYLEPTWINKLLRAILNHDLSDVTKEDFWEDELVKFSGRNNYIYFNLKQIHDNFPSTGLLTVGYLRFLWRDVTEISDTALFESLLRTMSRYGLIFQGNPTEAVSEHAENGLNDSADLFVPLHLPSNILDSDLEEFAILLNQQFRKELVYEIHQTYVPPGFLGLLMARFLFCEGVEFRKCWNRGAAFTLREVLVLLYLETPSHGEKKARITVNLFGVQFVSNLTEVMHKVQHEIKSMFVERFRGVIFGLKKGYPRDYLGAAIDSRYTTGGRSAVDSMSAGDIVNVVIEKIDGLEAHLDRELSRLLQGLHRLEGKLDEVAKSCHTAIVRLNELHSNKVRCPSLVIFRPAAAMESCKNNRSLWAIVRGLGRRAKKVVCKDMRLCFLCPYDFSEVPCGLDGNGYPFTATREWVTKIRPVLKVTAVLAKVAIRAASGLDLPVSDFLNGAKSYLGEELADSVPDDDAIEQALDGSLVPVGEGEAKKLVGKAHEELKQFIEEHECKDKAGYVHFDELMQLVDDGNGGKVWVSNQNVEAWQNPRS